MDNETDQRIRNAVAFVDSQTHSDREARNLQDRFRQEPAFTDNNELVQNFIADIWTYSLVVSYVPATVSDPESIRIICIIPDRHWFSIGFGPSMTNTDMIAWHADSANSYTEDYWSFARTIPKVDDTNDLRTNSQLLPAGAAVAHDRVAFETIRPLDTGDASEDYLIQVGEKMDMVYAFNIDTPDWRMHTLRGYFSMEFTDLLGNPDLTTVVPVEEIEPEIVAPVEKIEIPEEEEPTINPIIDTGSIVPPLPTPVKPVDTDTTETEDTTEPIDESQTEQEEQKTEDASTEEQNEGEVEGEGETEPTDISDSKQEEEKLPTITVTPPVIEDDPEEEETPITTIGFDFDSLIDLPTVTVTPPEIPDELEEPPQVVAPTVEPPTTIGFDFDSLIDLPTVTDTPPEIPDELEEPPQVVAPTVEPPAAFTPNEELSCLTNQWSSFKLDTCYDKLSQELVFRVQLPDNSWFGIGFGATMTNTDMIGWHVSNGEGEVKDYYSFGYGRPTEDKNQDIYHEVDPEFNAETGMMSFVSRRKLDTEGSKRRLDGHAGEQDYLFKLDEENVMNYAFKKDDRFFSFGKHSTSDRGVWSLRIDLEGEVEEADIDLKEFLRNDKIERHGLWMWSAWFVVGLLLLATKRYMKKTWKLSHYLHAFLGYFTLTVTIIFALSVTRWEPFAEVHNAIGSLCVFVTIFGSLSGSLTAALMRFYSNDKPWSKREKVEQVAKIHRYFGYVMLFLGNAAIMSGVGHYYGDFLKGDDRKVLGAFNMIVFLALVFICEGFYRIRNKYSMGHVATPTPTDGKKILTMTAEEVDRQVKQGKKLVIFDNLILDLNGYDMVHPGGKFNLRHNLGRDISKFFFGGYQLVNVDNKRPHTHSKFALDILKTLIVGVLKDQLVTRDELFRVTKESVVTECTSTFTFQTFDGSPVSNIKSWYNDPQMIGRHFLVFSVQDPTVKRHYTICSTMRPELKSALLTMAKSVIADQPYALSHDILSSHDTDAINLTLKTYNTQRGLSSRIHGSNFDLETSQKKHSVSDLSTEDTYFIKGPMGKGLQIQHEGVHVAFCAGTGALVFLDLVSSLLIQNCYSSDGQKLPDNAVGLGNGFVLHLYCAFASREEAIGLDVIEALQKVNEKLGLTNFKATIRLSKTDGPKLPRWTENYIESELTPLAGQLKRVWVVGPPKMNETFDRLLEKIGPSKLRLDESMYEVM